MVRTLLEVIEMTPGTITGKSAASHHGKGYKTLGTVATGTHQFLVNNEESNILLALISQEAAGVISRGAR